MRKLFKNGKQILAFMLAFAVLSVSLFTGAALSVSADASVLYWNGDFTEPTDTDNDGIYEIDAASDIAYLAQKTQANSYVTKGKTYKVVDGVKAIVMQPEALGAIKDKTSAAEVKAFFDANAASAKVWNVIGYNGQYPFQGTFDGNGATVYGIYNNWDQYTASGNWQKDLYGGLFGLVDNGAVIKNVAVMNSHFTTNTGFIGPIFANAASDGWNAVTENKGKGNVVVENCISANNYIRITSGAHKANAGTLIGSTINDYAKINNCLVYGNDAVNTGFSGPDGSTSMALPLLNTNGDKNMNDVTNVIALGTTPYNKYDFGWSVYVQDDGGTGSIFQNVYTDQAISGFTMYAGTTAYNNFEEAAMGGLAKVDAGVKGDAAKTAMSALDWDTVWFAGANAPTLRAFHSISSTLYSEGAVYHYYSCSDCDLTSEQVKHTYQQVGTDYLCTVCGHECLHDGDHGMTSFQSAGDCVTAAGTYTDCPCGYTYYFVTGEPAEGHKFTTHNDVDPGDCETDGTAEHWICEDCNKIFITDDIWATMDNAVAPEALNTGRGEHQPETETTTTTTTTNNVIYNNIDGHWYKCEICSGRLDFDINKLEDGQNDVHNYKDGECQDCGWLCQHDFEKTGKIAVIGDCTTDELAEVKCTICAIKGTVLSKKASHKIKLNPRVEPTDKMEGTESHYQCEACNNIYADENGKTAVTAAELIIPRKLAEKDDVPNLLPSEIEQPENQAPTIPEDNNIDTSDKSPSTGDSLISVMAVAALAGAALVITRKK